ncbi:MAG: polyphosphate kinase 1 [Myxococcales bacterium]|nr:polyphosphate kinase 1 [Myxococcota bacterium]MDW8283711.1 polyphosphate kinase 1 [Myxococcales bacterium]
MEHRDSPARSGRQSPSLPLQAQALSNPLTDPSLYINRELSWLEFNQRVLDEALDPSVPLLERLKFLGISASNLDEFFMVRVAGLKQQLSSGVVETGPDGLLPSEVLARIALRAQRMVTEQYRLLRQDLLPRLQQAGLCFLAVAELDAEQRRYIRGYFESRVYPALTPLAVDPGHPFPHLRNRSLNLAILLQRGPTKPLGQEAYIAVVQVPGMLGRLVEVPTSGRRRAFVYLEDIIAEHVGDLFPGTRVLGCWAFRVTRNFDMTIDEEESMDLLQTIQKEVRRRDRGNAVRLECQCTMDMAVRRYLGRALRLEPQDIYPVDGPLHLSDLMAVYGLNLAGEARELHDEPFTPQIQSRLEEAGTLFEAIAQGDILLHQPYESFESVVDFIEEAAEDPNVLAIKGTLYRTSGNSPIVAALVRAAECGKQVTALVELKARFDEENNIAWARQLEEAGVHVVYGLIGLKTHCKVALVVRREGGGIRRYVHLSTGNYNTSTARAYTDLSFFTCREEFGTDASALFNLLTGYSQPPRWERFVVAPLGLKERIIELIDAEAQAARRGEPARIIAKMNALADRDVTRALYAASQSGVRIDLLVRGICCLRPGVPGISENIRVVSLVDRFLEHSRIFFFEAGGRKEVYVSSADWMVRNFERRVELMFPIEDPALKTRIIDEILATLLADNVKARLLRRDGTYERLQPAEGEAPVRAQQRFIELARAQASVPLVEKGLRIRPTMLLRLPASPPPRPARLDPPSQPAQATEPPPGGAAEAQTPTESSRAQASVRGV